MQGVETHPRRNAVNSNVVEGANTTKSSGTLRKIEALNMAQVGRKRIDNRRPMRMCAKQRLERHVLEANLRVRYYEVA